jgi:hypothetical protein
MEHYRICEFTSLPVYQSTSLPVYHGLGVRLGRRAGHGTLQNL